MNDKKGPGDRAPLAYKNEEFLESPDSRPLRIVSEYLEPLAHFRRQRIRDTIVFFGSARIQEDGPLGEYYRDARTLASMVTPATLTSIPIVSGFFDDRGSYVSRY